MVRAQAVEGALEPVVLAAPPLGRSGDLRVRKAVHDALGADPTAIGRHVFRVSARFGQGVDGRRALYMRLDLDEDFPLLPHDTLPDRLRSLQSAGAARCAAVLGPDFQVFVSFGGKKLR